MPQDWARLGKHGVYARDGGYGDRDSVAVGLERTGRIVTAAALLLSIAIGAFVEPRDRLAGPLVQGLGRILRQSLAGRQAAAARRAYYRT